MLLIAAAVTAEIEALIGGPGFVRLGENCWRHRNKPVLVVAIGIGLVDFSAGLEAVLKDHAIDRVILTGSCGVYPGVVGQWSVGSLVAPREVILADSLAPSGKTYFPAPLPQYCRLDEELAACLLPSADGRALTLAAITTDDDIAWALEQHYQAHFEQMELFALARVCELHRLPAAALLGVTNRVGAAAHQQWRSTAAAVAERCCEHLRKVFQL